MEVKCVTIIVFLTKNVTSTMYIPHRGFNWTSSFEFKILEFEKRVWNKVQTLNLYLWMSEQSEFNWQP